jgi:predicted short-subunit dehydrogenase-like oxidoreductase (DUF2520 family)
VATHLSRHLYSSGHRITCVWSRNPEHSRHLAEKVGSRGISGEEPLPGGADFCLLAVPDRAIETLAARFAGYPGIWLHTAGAVPMVVLGRWFRDFGVLYPLQTLSTQRELSLKETPMLVEGSAGRVAQMIRNIAGSISDRVVEMDSGNRLLVHLAAVFANNFTNHMIYLAEEILKQNGLDTSLLAPILRETYLKLQEMPPSEAQTGPALRNDLSTLQRHLEGLKGHPEWEKLYTFISRDIQRSHYLPSMEPGSPDDQF